MIQPQDIRQKAERLFPSFLKAWLDGDATFFPRAIPANKVLQEGRVTQSAADVQRLRDGSREVLGYGYTVEWEDRKSRAFGRNRFPARIIFETQDDLFALHQSSLRIRCFPRRRRPVARRIPRAQ